MHGNVSKLCRAGGGARQATADCKALTDGAYSISRLAASDIYCHRCSCTTRRLLNRVEKSPFPEIGRKHSADTQPNHQLRWKKVLFRVKRQKHVNVALTIVT